MSWDLEEMVLTSRLRFLHDEIQLAPDGLVGLHKAANLRDVAFDAHRLLGDGAAVGHDGDLLQEPLLVCRLDQFLDAAAQRAAYSPSATG